MRNLTKGKARAAYNRLCKAEGVTPQKEPFVVQGAGQWPGTGPVLCKDYEGWYDTTRWAIVWEGGPEDWVSRASERERQSMTVFAEPINSYALGLYPAI